ncbi:M61 family metallopeptidase [soil metagenome]
MTRSLLSASLSVVSLAAALSTSAMAQTAVITDATKAPLALAGVQSQIPPVTTGIPYPGVIRYRADVIDLDRRIVSVTESIPVAGGPVTLLYPKFLPGNHAATGPIQLLSGLTIVGNGARIEWTRDTLDPYAFHLDVPVGVTEIEVAFQWLTQPDNATWRVVMTPNMVDLQWEKALLYPAGYASNQITVAASVRLPEGWQYGTALTTETFADGVATFAPVDLYTLVDSPMVAGAHYRRIDLDPQGEGGREAIHLNLIADREANLAATDPQIGLYRDLVTQADRLFGARHFDHYDFLLALTDELGSIGLEHHRSSEDTEASTYFTSWDKSAGNRALLPHEFTHSWNGKFMRPADELTANYNVPTQNTLLWVYEGQTEYWGEVLATRSGLHSREAALVVLARTAALYANQPGRAWRSLQDTDNHNLLGYRVTGQWTSWMRGTGDYYRESQLIWLDADTLIREGTAGRKSLDDFARAFFGHDDDVFTPQGYTFEDLTAALNTVYPHDWATFLRSRLDAVGPEATAPLDGITRAGYRLTYTDSLTPIEKTVQTTWANDFQYSLGFSLTGPTNRLSAIQWGGLAYQQAIGAGWDLIAINGEAATPERLRDAVTGAKGTDTPISLLLKSGTHFRTVAFDYHDGLRYPRLGRIPGTPDRLADIWAPRRR